MTNLDAAVNRALQAFPQTQREFSAQLWAREAVPVLTTPTAFMAGVAFSSAIINAYNAGANAG
ncbi:hypothetical protein [Curtobacterium sp. UCD-KPL2560]|uniref:hypothetical protein n=1 Tax=Curtobacterium sp. UCD-KPL2560 TaxID=1885315 RepID=UPI0008253C5C|nr:hypothetical protein [Curtobacterium sp. UCD-KPL2560]